MTHQRRDGEANSRNGEADSRDEDQFIDWDAPRSPATPPPPEAIDWVGQQLSDTVTDVVALPGGMSSAVHRLRLASGAEPVVLRRYTVTDWIEREPYIPHDEARMLAMVGGLDIGVAAPSLLLADPDGIHCDVPAIVMTEVPGAPLIDPTDPDDWADRLAACLADIHRVNVATDGPTTDGPTAAAVAELPRFRRWDRPGSPVPTWIENGDRWRQAQALVAGPLPEGRPCFLHRDYHPNNVHWQEGEICAVVDWLSACIGPAAVDLSHCRWNLAILVNMETAERFTTRYRELTGYEEDLMEHDLATILSGPVGPFPTFAWNALGRHDLTSASVGPRVESWLAHVLGERR